jgi:antitoxin HicB
MIVTYFVNLTPDDGTLLVTCPDLPEVTTFGADEDEAMARARDAIEEALAARISDGREIPKPTSALRAVGRCWDSNQRPLRCECSTAPLTLADTARDDSYFHVVDQSFYPYF